jgi:hypothetical protein
MIHHPSFFDHAQHLNQDGVNLYVDALKLDRRLDLPDDVRRHVSECPACKRRILDLSAVLRGVSFPREEAHPFLDRQRPVQSSAIFSSYYRIAAGVLLLIGASAVVVYLTTRRPAEHEALISQPVASVDSAGTTGTREPPHPEVFAENFSESPTLQRFVDHAFRSGEIDVISPSVGQIMGDSLLFHWKAQVPAPFVLRIVNNREDPVFESTIRSSHYVLTKRLTPGLYYWKLESHDELLYVGKFLVR